MLPVGTGSRSRRVRFVILEHQSALAPRRVVGMNGAALGSFVERNDRCVDGFLRPRIRILDHDAGVLHSSARSTAITAIALTAALILAYSFGG